IEDTLADLARSLTAAQPLPPGLIHPDFRGTPLGASQEKLVRSKGGLEVFGGAPSRDFIITAAGFEAELRALLAGFTVVDWAKFKVTGIEGTRTQVLFQIAGSAADRSRRQIRVEWSCEWRKAVEGKWQLARLESGPISRSAGRGPLFTDVSEAALGSNPSYRDQLTLGVEVWRRRMDAATGMDIYGHQGVAVGDFDGDGLEDFYVCQPGGLPNRLFRNLGNGRFEEVSEKAGVDVLDATSMALFADIDNNGTQDLILILSAGQPLLFLNDARGHFRLSPNAFPPRAAGGGTMMSAALADYDRDGYLDLYVTAYNWPVTAAQLPRPYHDATNGPPNVMYRNRGGGTFEDVTEKTGLNQNNNRFSFACSWGDYDHDGWPDLYVANDFGRKNLYHNNRNGTFTDVAAEAGVEDIGAGMSAAWGDYDGDGWEDLYAGNMWSSAGRRVTAQDNFKTGQAPALKGLYQRHARGNSLLRNLANGRFEDVTLRAGVEMGRWAWCSDFLDFDNDGYEDLYIANGFISGAKERDL
ncbi:MAG: VCBS repeat-containing protein, partial [Acidobacteria bacterium]|nr:VCBS repeat-containing protein [Acidobacteriota bacterium]